MIPYADNRESSGPLVSVITTHRKLIFTLLRRTKPLLEYLEADQRAKVLRYGRFWGPKKEHIQKRGFLQHLPQHSPIRRHANRALGRRREAGGGTEPVRTIESFTSRRLLGTSGVMEMKANLSFQTYISEKIMNNL